MKAIRNIFGIILGIISFYGIFFICGILDQNFLSDYYGMKNNFWWIFPTDILVAVVLVVINALYWALIIEDK